ncbi:MAG TPA: SDR family oxidoreductase [Solirubrobacteraceae bacterium]|nr:SDR family oxidoreductase [Solirubrobacteraceae bacterium]
MSRAASKVVPRTGEAVLVTGATGFVGMAVLARLLERTDRDVVVLLRATSRSHANARLDTLLGSFFEAPEVHRRRVRAVCADLTSPGLGLGVERERIAEEVREVIHGAASVAFDLTLAESRSVNVEGTRRVLELAEECAVRGEGLRRMTYVSTAYVAGDRHGCARETELEVGQGFRNAYEESKHGAERLVSSRREHLPVTVVRPSIVVGDRATGWTASFNVVYGPLRAFANGTHSVIPGRRDAVLDIVTVDHVADAILALAASPAAAGGTFHVVAGEQATTLGELAHLAARHFDRRPPRLVCPRIYRSVLHPLILRRADPNTRRRLVRNEVYLPYFSLDLRFDDSRARELLDPLDIRATPVGEYFDTLIDFAEAARWGRTPIGRAGARALRERTRQATSATAEPVT